MKTDVLGLPIALCAVGFLVWQLNQGKESTSPIATAPAASSETWTVKSVADGDTVTLTKGTSQLKVRLCGIDAPEKAQPLGQEAKEKLRSLLAKYDNSVKLYKVETDRYGRTVGELFTVKNQQPEIFVNESIVSSGFAYHYSRYSSNCPNKVAIANAEELAKSKRLGVWGIPNSIKPWDFRKSQKS